MTTSQPRKPQNKPNTLTDSLAKLGIRISRMQVVSILVGAISGMIFARVLPYIFTNTWGFLQNFLFGPAATSFRDTLNTFVFTSLTCLCSFGVSFFISVFAAYRQKRANEKLRKRAARR